MNSRFRSVTWYAPGLAFLLAGVAVLVTTSLTTPLTCSCSTGPNGTKECVPCPSGEVIHPAGPLLLVGAAVYALAIFWIRLYLRSRRPPS
jgi:hypothetical protein